MVSFACQRNLFQGVGAVKTTATKKNNGVEPLFFCFIRIVLVATTAQEHVSCFHHGKACDNFWVVFVVSCLLFCRFS